MTKSFTGTITSDGPVSGKDVAGYFGTVNSSLVGDMVSFSFTYDATKRQPTLILRVLDMSLTLLIRILRQRRRSSRSMEHRLLKHPLRGRRRGAAIARMQSVALYERAGRLSFSSLRLICAAHPMGMERAFL